MNIFIITTNNKKHNPEIKKTQESSSKKSVKALTIKEIPNDKKIATIILSNINTFCLFRLSSGFIGLFSFKFPM